MAKDDPILLQRIGGKDYTLVADPVIVLPPRRSGDYLVVEDEELNIHCYGRTMDQLYEMLTAEIFVLWEQYAKADISTLSSEAIELKATLLKRLRIA